MFFQLNLQLIIKLMMNSITEEKQARFLARPLKQKQHRQSPEANIFLALRSSEPLPILSKKIRGKSYDFVGSHQFKQKYIEPEEIAIKNTEEEKESPNPQNNLTNSMMNSTINRQTILSKMTKEQTNLATKQMRQLNRYREYQDYWESKSKTLHKLTLRDKGAKTLLEDNVKDLYVHQNQDRMDIINNFVVNMWQMSLRNNNKILQRHIVGNKFKPVELEEMLQTDRGIKTVERKKLKLTSKRELSLTGRNKAWSQTSRSGATTDRLSLNRTPNQEEVYKISYTGNVKWMSTEGL